MRDDEHTVTDFPTGTPVRANKIQWTLAPLESLLEQTDPLTLTGTELLAYCADLQAETRWLRLALHESIHQLAKLTDDLKRSARVIEFQRQQIRRGAA